MLSDALKEHWNSLESIIPEQSLKPVQEFLGGVAPSDHSVNYDRRTRQNFTKEWDNHEIGGRTWGIELEDRVEWFFCQPIRIPREHLRGKLMLDAGCGNGSQSVAYTVLGMEVIAIDLSSGLEHGQAFRSLYPNADPSKVHFIQADLQRPPLRPACVDIIHSAGVLHHTPNTYTTFQALRPLLKPDGTFYVWVYKYEKFVTPLVNSIRAITTCIPPSQFARIAGLMAIPFMAFCAGVDRLGIRQYSQLTSREAALALMDIFGAPYAHYHSFEEVVEWYRSEGFHEVWGCNDGRRGFGVCGRLDSQPI